MTRNFRHIKKPSLLEEKLSENLLKYHEKQYQEAFKYFMDNIEEVVSQFEFKGTSKEWLWSNSPLDQMKKLFELAKTGKEEPRWLERIKTLEKRLEKIREVSGGR